MSTKTVRSISKVTHVSPGKINLKKTNSGSISQLVRVL